MIAWPKISQNTPIHSRLLLIKSSYCQRFHLHTKSSSWEARPSLRYGSNIHRKVDATSGLAHASLKDWNVNMCHYLIINWTIERVSVSRLFQIFLHLQISCYGVLLQLGICLKLHLSVAELCKELIWQYIISVFQRYEGSNFTTIPAKNKISWYIDQFLEVELQQILSILTANQSDYSWSIDQNRCYHCFSMFFYYFDVVFVFSKI